MMDSNFKGVYDMIKDWADAEDDAGTLIYGHLMLIADYVQRSGTKFPLIYLEEPKVTSQHRQEGSNFWDLYEMGVWFVIDFKKEEQEDIVVKSAEMWTLMSKFHKYLIAKDEEMDFLGRGGDVIKEPLDPMIMTKVVGWRMDFQLLLNANKYLFS